MFKRNQTDCNTTRRNLSTAQSKGRKGLCNATQVFDVATLYGIAMFDDDSVCQRKIIHSVNVLFVYLQSVCLYV